ncbi:hypothetical protein [Methylobacterium sp. J-092]|uniref:hypothetical protein n=1 Tax=Methylobacterium sp. J-092 TaxID=2836667 RepID=UPI001FB8756B|nr:hypothetical protein [Methylobacterium sp. J-092]MCJ2007021.1 hypothetical protein [Methylobacterium sp. J-092]
MTLTDSQLEALRALKAAVGEGAIDKHGGVVSAGERLPFLADTWLRLMTLDPVEGAGPMRVGLTAAGVAAASPAGRKIDPRFLRTDNQPTPAPPGAE